MDFKYDDTRIINLYVHSFVNENSYCVCLTNLKLVYFKSVKASTKITMKAMLLEHISFNLLIVNSMVLNEHHLELIIESKYSSKGCKSVFF